MAGWLAGRPAAGGIEINTNSAHQLGLSWDLAGLSLATRASPIHRFLFTFPKTLLYFVDED